MDAEAKDASKIVTDLFLDYLILSEVSKGNYTRQEVVKALDLPTTAYVDSLVLGQYLTLEGKTLKLTEKGHERCIGFNKLVERLYPYDRS